MLNKRYLFAHMVVFIATPLYGAAETLLTVLRSGNPWSFHSWHSDDLSKTKEPKSYDDFSDIVTFYQDELFPLRSQKIITVGAPVQAIQLLAISAGNRDLEARMLASFSGQRKTDLTLKKTINKCKKKLSAPSNLHFFAMLFTFKKTGPVSQWSLKIGNNTLKTSIFDSDKAGGRHSLHERSAFIKFNPRSLRWDDFFQQEHIRALYTANTDRAKEIIAHEQRNFMDSCSEEEVLVTVNHQALARLMRKFVKEEECVLL